MFSLAVVMAVDTTTTITVPTAVQSAVDAGSEGIKAGASAIGSVLDNLTTQVGLKEKANGLTNFAHHFFGDTSRVIVAVGVALLASSAVASLGLHKFIKTLSSIGAFVAGLFLGWWLFDVVTGKEESLFGANEPSLGQVGPALQSNNPIFFWFAVAGFVLGVIVVIGMKKKKIGWIRSIFVGACVFVGITFVGILLLRP